MICCKKKEKRCRIKVVVSLLDMEWYELAGFCGKLGVVPIDGYQSLGLTMAQHCDLLDSSRFLLSISGTKFTWVD